MANRPTQIHYVTLFEKTYSQHEGIIANIAKLLVL